MTPQLENTSALGQNAVPEHVKRRQTAAAACAVGFRRWGLWLMLRVEGGVAVVTQQRLRVLPVLMTEQVDSCGGRRLRSFQGYQKVSPHFQGSSEDPPTTPQLQQQVKYTRGVVKEGDASRFKGLVALMFTAQCGNCFSFHVQIRVLHYITLIKTNSSFYWWFSHIINK